MKAVFSCRAFTAVMAETAEKVRTETGGLFLGRLEGDTWYIIEAIDPGPKSIFQVAYFEYDRNYTEHLINKIANLYEAKLELIGLWHRHPGSMDYFSSTDDGTNAKYAAMRPQGAISGLVNIDPEFRFTMYHVDSPCYYSKIKYEVGDEKIPTKYTELKTKEKLLQIMDERLGRKKITAVANSLQELTSLIPECCEKIEELSEHHSLEELDVRNIIIDEIIDDIVYLSETKEIPFSVKQKGYLVAIVQNINNKSVPIIFAYDETNEKMQFLYDEKCYAYRKGLFKDILSGDQDDEVVDKENVDYNEEKESVEEKEPVEEKNEPENEKKKKRSYFRILRGDKK